MPQAAKIAFDALLERLARDPWDVGPWKNPEGNLRLAVFGEHGEGLATIVVLDRDERVGVVRVAWRH